MCSLLLVSLLGVAIWQGGRLPEIPTATKPTETTATTEADESLSTDKNNITENGESGNQGALLQTDPAEKNNQGVIGSAPDSEASKENTPSENTAGTSPSQGAEGDASGGSSDIPLPPDPPEKPTLPTEPNTGEDDSDHEDPVAPTEKPMEPTTAVEEATLPTEPMYPVEPTTAQCATEMPTEPTTAPCTTARPEEETTEPTESDTAETTPAAPDFEYPEESTDDEFVVICDGRKYSASVGDTITFAVDLWVAEKFENTQFRLSYDTDKLDVVDRTASEVIEDKAFEAAGLVAPNVSDGICNLFYGKRWSDQSANMISYNASNVYGMDFREKKRFAQIEFMVISPGECSLNIEIQELTEKGGRLLITSSEMKDPDSVKYVQYVLVND